jgi:thiol-disulfide isomerase/thioredoxin
MRHIILAVTVSLLCACSEPPNQSLPADLKNYRGQWLVINYWAQWCKPCIQEIPELNQLNQVRSDVTVLGVNYDGATGEELATQVNDFAISFPMLIEDPANSLATSRPIVLPTTLIVSPQGTLVQTLVGPQTLESLIAAVDQSQAENIH